MSCEVILKREARMVSGAMVRINEACSMPASLARALENKGLCVIVTTADNADAGELTGEVVEVKAPVAAKARKAAASAKAKRPARKKAAAKK